MIYISDESLLSRLIFYDLLSLRRLLGIELQNNSFSCFFLSCFQVFERVIIDEELIKLMLDMLDSLEQKGILTWMEVVDLLQFFYDIYVFSI